LQNRFPQFEIRASGMSILQNMTFSIYPKNNHVVAKQSPFKRDMLIEEAHPLKRRLLRPDAARDAVASQSSSQRHEQKYSWTSLDEYRD